MGLGRELEGVTVVALEQAVAAPYCSLLLADSGARIIKIERAEGDFCRNYDRAANGHSSYFVWLNRGKESIVLDIDKPDDFALLKKMLASADVFLSNLAPGATDKRGLIGDELRKINPGLITCEITGYGRTGPYAEMKAYDLLVQAETGLCSITGGPEAPARVGVSMCDISTGLTAYSGILRALLLRGRTGKGVDISVSMFDVIADWMNVPLMFQRYLGKSPPRIGVAHASVQPYGVYIAGDGGEVVISIQNNREWKMFCEGVLERPEFATDQRFADNPDRVANKPAMNAEIALAFARHNRPDLIKLLNRHRIACANLSTVADLDHHVQLRPQPARIAGVDVVLADLPVMVDGPRPTRVPGIGEDGDKIRAEFA